MKKIMFTMCLLVFILTACTSTKVPGYIGTYNLISVNGNKLPFLSVESATFTLNTDNTCKGTITAKVVFSTNEFESEETFDSDSYCTYTNDGNTFNFQWKGDDAGTTTGLLDGDILTVEATGIPFVYQK